jgi:hypothetical protein
LPLCHLISRIKRELPELSTNPRRRQGFFRLCAANNSKKRRGKSKGGKGRREEGERKVGEPRRGPHRVAPSKLRRCCATPRGKQLCAQSNTAAVTASGSYPATTPPSPRQCHGIEDLELCVTIDTKQKYAPLPPLRERHRRQRPHRRPPCDATALD